MSDDSLIDVLLTLDRAGKERKRAKEASGRGSEHVVNAPRSNGHGTVGDGSEGELKVIPARELKRGDDIYRMVRNPRGMCIIINNCDFRYLEARRAGSVLDVVRMECLFAAFQFECQTHYNLSAGEMMDLLSAKAKAEQQKAADCLVVILMSHGDRGTIYGVDDEELPLDDIYEKFNNSNCPSLQGKPKLFFVQTCRGRKSDTGTAEYVAPDMADVGRIPANSGSEPCAQDAPPRRVPSYSDMYICYASVPGYESHRNITTGTWFLSAVYKVFSQHACTMHLEELMHLVNDEVISRFTRYGYRQTPSGDPRGWRKKLYFHPGLFLERTA